MTINDIGRKACTGCCACSNICSKNAIRISKDEEGFYIPRIDTEVCTNCGKCYSICPAKELVKVGSSLNGLLIRLKDNQNLKNSASGGAFYGLASYLISKHNAVVVGAAITDDLSVKHIIVNSIDELVKLQNSKYVQSYIGNIYTHVLEKLEDGRIVLFSGTPCQVAGLYAVVPKKKRDYLYTIDLVCHGVPSPSLLDRQLKMDSKSPQGKVVDFCFRFKNKNYESISSYMMMMMMERGLPKIRRTVQDVYYNLFMNGYDFRESCYECKYANLQRIGDFTVGDCDSKEFYPNFHPNESNSILLINTEKANDLWEQVSDLFDVETLDVLRESEYNHQLSHPFERPKERDGIYEDLLYEDWEIVSKKYALSQGKFERYKLLMMLNMPSWLKKIIYSIKKG